jgi:tetratricopeptide (TPR) repeat protein
MSLLIKALEQAAESKNAGDKVELSLEPFAANEAALKDANATPQYSQKAASTVFSAKTNAQPKPSNKLAWFALAALILVLAATGYFYWYWQSLAAPELVVVRPFPAQNVPSTQVVSSQPVSANLNAEIATPIASDNMSPTQAQHEVASPAGENKVDTPLPAERGAKLESSVVMTPSKQKKKIAIPSIPLTEQSLSKPVKRANISKSLVFGASIPLIEDSSLKVVKNQPTAGINPKLVDAYNAYTKGDDAQAQQAYREVLKGDVRNTDALLGMATIAARQGRNDDAIGWYKKTLEIEPRNHVAQAGIVSLQQQDDPISAETRFKNMIAQQPESASLYAALGDLYVSQNQWPSAQQAYFQAYHFEPNNAQHVFNLAVSLDHMSKPNLAIPYYKRALELVTASGATNIDRAKLESRISQLSQ